MPLYDLECSSESCRARAEVYLALRGEANPPCERCGASTERVWGRTGRDAANGFPYFTKNISGQWLEVRSSQHQAELCKQYGKVCRDDAAFIEEGNDYDVIPGHMDRKTGRLVPPQVVYKRGSGRGNKGQWV